MLFFPLHQKIMQFLITLLNLPHKMGKIPIHPGNPRIDMLNKPSHMLDNDPQLSLEPITIPLDKIGTGVQGMHLMRPMHLILVHTARAQGFLVVLAVQGVVVVMGQAFLGHFVHRELLD